APASLATEPELFAEACLHNRAALGLAGRAAGLPVQFVDLTPYYNQSTDTNWLALGKPPEEGLPPTVRELEGVPFDIRGSIQLGNSFGDRGTCPHLSPLRIGHPLTRLHFLTQGHGQSSAQPFRLRVHYANHETVESPGIMPDRDTFRPAAWKNPRPEVP